MNSLWTRQVTKLTNKSHVCSCWDPLRELASGSFSDVFMDISWTFHGHFMDISWTFHGIMQPEWQGFGDKSFENEAIGDVEVEGPFVEFYGTMGLSEN